MKAPARGDSLCLVRKSILDERDLVLSRRVKGKPGGDKGCPRGWITREEETTYFGVHFYCGVFFLGSG